MRSTAGPPDGTARGGWFAPGAARPEAAPSPRHPRPRGHCAGHSPLPIGGSTGPSRRLPPPSRPQRTLRSLLTAPHRRLNRRFTATHSADRYRESTSGRPERSLAGDQQDRVERGVEPERGPDRPPSQEDPAESESDRDPRSEGHDRLLERFTGPAPGDRQDMGQREHEPRLDDPASHAIRLRPGGGREPAKEQLLAERREDDSG